MLEWSIWQTLGCYLSICVFLHKPHLGPFMTVSTVRPFLCVLTMWKLCGFGKGRVSSKITVYDCTWYWLFLREPHEGMVGPAWNLSSLSPPLPDGPHLPPHSDTLRAPVRPSPSLLGHGVQLSWPSMSW